MKAKNKMLSEKEINDRLAYLLRDKKTFKKRYPCKDYFYDAEIECLRWALGISVYCATCGRLQEWDAEGVTKDEWQCYECR